MRIRYTSLGRLAGLLAGLLAVMVGLTACSGSESNPVSDLLEADRPTFLYFYTDN